MSVDLPRVKNGYAPGENEGSFSPAIVGDHSRIGRPPDGGLAGGSGRLQANSRVPGECEIEAAAPAGLVIIGRIEEEKTRHEGGRRQQARCGTLSPRSRAWFAHHRRGFFMRASADTQDGQREQRGDVEEAVPRHAKMDQQMRGERRRDGQEQQESEIATASRLSQPQGSSGNEKQAGPQSPQQGRTKLHGVPYRRIHDPQVPHRVQETRVVRELGTRLAISRPAARVVQHCQQPGHVHSGEEDSRERRALPAVVPENHDQQRKPERAQVLPVARAQREDKCRGEWMPVRWLMACPVSHSQRKAPTAMMAV